MEKIYYKAKINNIACKTPFRHVYIENVENLEGILVKPRILLDKKSVFLSFDWKEYEYLLFSDIVKQNKEKTIMSYEDNNKIVIN